MVTEIWPEHVTSKSWRVLNELAARLNPVLIGGWAVYLWTGAMKSADVDLFVTDESLWKIGARVKRHPKLKKYHALIDDVDIDIYTPSVCDLAVSAGEVFEKRWYALVKEFNVLLPEPLLVLKCEAARARWAGRKGFKDRCDVLSLLRFEKLDFKTLRKLLPRYKELNLAKTLREIVQKSVEEYRVLGLDPWVGRKNAREVLNEIVR